MADTDKKNTCPLCGRILLVYTDEIKLNCGTITKTYVEYCPKCLHINHSNISISK